MTMIAPKVQSSSGRRAPSYMVIGYYMRRFRGEAENKVEINFRKLKIQLNSTFES